MTRVIIGPVTCTTLILFGKPAYFDVSVHCSLQLQFLASAAVQAGAASVAGEIMKYIYPLFLCVLICSIILTTKRTYYTESI